MRLSEHRRQSLYLTVTLSGVAALSHELLWTRRLVDLLGSSSTATVRVLGTFFVGLSVGAALAAHVVPRLGRPMRALAMAEVAVAALSLPALTLPAWSGWIWQAVGADRVTTATGSAAKLASAILVIGPPAVAMGLTLPLAVAAGRGVAAGQEGLASRLYALNTAGAVVGVAAVSAWLFSGHDATSAMWITAGLNLLAAAVVVVNDRAPTMGLAAREAEAAVRALPPRDLLLAFLSGAGVLALEVIALHLIMLVATMSFLAPAVILACVIAVLAIAAFVAPRVSKRMGNTHAITVALCGGGAIVAVAPFVYMALVRHNMLASASSGPLPFVLSTLLLTVATVAPGALLLGVVFPLLMTAVETTHASAPARPVATLLAVNGVGGLVGSEVAHGVLLPAFGPHVALGALGAAYAVGGVVLTCASVTTAGRARALSYALACAATALLVTSLGLPTLPTLNPHLGFDSIAERSDRMGTLTVADHPHLGRAMIVNNQYVLGSTAAQADQERQAHIPLLLHPAPRDVAFIGLATGASAGASLMHQDVEHVEVMELSGAVIDAAASYFAKENHGVVDDPRVTIVEEDGRTYVGASHERFDVIVGDLFLPWSAGVGRLYSVEHFAAVRRALKPGGVFCQWLPMYQLTATQLDLVVASLGAAFPELHLFRNQLRPDKPVLGLVAFKEGELSWGTASDRAQAERGSLKDPTVRHGVALAMLYLGRVTVAPKAVQAVNTLQNLALEQDAARVRLSQEAAENYLQGNRFGDYLQKRVAAVQQDATLRPDLRRLVELGFELTAWESAVRARHASEVKLHERIERSFPLVVRSDGDADWTRWPGLGHWRAAALPQARSVPVAQSARAGHEEGNR